MPRARRSTDPAGVVIGWSPIVMPTTCTTAAGSAPGITSAVSSGGATGTTSGGACGRKSARTDESWSSAVPMTHCGDGEVGVQQDEAAPAHAEFIVSAAGINSSGADSVGTDAASFPALVED